MLNQNDQEPIIIQRGSETAPGLRSRRKESLVPSCHWVALQPLDFATLDFFSFGCCIWELFALRFVSQTESDDNEWLFPVVNMA